MSQVKAIPNGYHSLTPILTQDDTRKAIAWYKQAFGAEEMFSSVGPDNVVMHALVRIGDSFIMMHDAMKHSKGPKEYGGSPAGLWIYTEDGDGLFDRAVKAGATVGQPMTDMFWGDRFGFLTDPFGYGWAIATHKEDVTPQELDRRAKEAFATSDCR
jgi:PhnB protein